MPVNKHIFKYYSLVRKCAVVIMLLRCVDASAQLQPFSADIYGHWAGQDDSGNEIIVSITDQNIITECPSGCNEGLFAHDLRRSYEVAGIYVQPINPNNFIVVEKNRRGYLQLYLDAGTLIFIPNRLLKTKIKLTRKTKQIASHNKSNHRTSDPSLNLIGTWLIKDCVLPFQSKTIISKSGDGSLRMEATSIGKDNFHKVSDVVIYHPVSELNNEVVLLEKETKFAMRFVFINKDNFKSSIGRGFNFEVQHPPG